VGQGKGCAAHDKSILSGASNCEQFRRAIEGDGQVRYKVRCAKIADALASRLNQFLGTIERRFKCRSPGIATRELVRNALNAEH
jgi:hypothetical protein